MNNLQQKHYEGFIKTAIQRGLSYPQATYLYKQAGLGSYLKQHVIPTGAEAAQFGREIVTPGTLATGSAGLLGGAGLLHLGQHPSMPAPAAAGASADAPAPAPAPASAKGMPEWLKLLLVGGGSALGGAGLATMMQPHEEEKHDPRMLV